MKSQIILILSVFTITIIIQSCIGTSITHHEYSKHDCTHETPLEVKDSDEAVKIALAYMHTWNIKSIIEDSVTVELDKENYYNILFRSQDSAITPPGVLVCVKKANGCAHISGLE